MLAVHTALSVQSNAAQAEIDARLKAEAEAQKQRDLDSALAETVELVARHRARLGRKTCSVHDGATIRRIYDLLRSLFPAGLEGADE